jgi:hypothetical protein
VNRKIALTSGAIPLLPAEDLSPSLEELETRLENQIASLPAGLDDAHCLYYLCTTRCSGTKCPVFCACDIVVELGGTGDAL